MKRYGKPRYSHNGRGLRDRVAPNHTEARHLEQLLRDRWARDARNALLVRDGQVSYGTRGTR